MIISQKMSNNNELEENLNENHCSSFFQSSCPSNGFIPEKSVENRREEVGVFVLRDQQVRDQGWSTSLRGFPRMSESVIKKTLIAESTTFPQETVAAKAYLHRKQGYKLWKEGCVGNIFVKADVLAQTLMFLVKSRVHASMKNIFYNVYNHMDQVNGDVMFSKCNCKAGQGDCCEHVAALLYTLLDFATSERSMIPDSLTCTQLTQKWHMPSTANMTLSKAVKFNDVSFTNAEPNRELEKAFKSSARNNYCAAPSLADSNSSDSLKQLFGDLQNHGNANLFCKAVQSNDYHPSMFSETSCKRKSFNNSAQDVPAENTRNEAIYKVFENISNENNSLIDCFILEELRGKTNMLVGFSKEQDIEICINSKMQAKSPT